MYPLLVIATATLLAACASPIATLNAVVPERSRFTQGIAYGEHARQRLDVYRPSGAAPASGLPMVVFFYGGSWNTGERADYKFVGEALAARGVLALIADYRLYPEVRYPDFLRDSARALAYGLRHASELGADPQRVFVMGHSAGAYNAAMLALDGRWLRVQGSDPKQLAGWIGLAGPYDFLPISNPDVKPVFHHPDYPPNSQPIDFAGPGSPAAFIGAAGDDTLVDPQRNAAQMATRLRDAGVPVTQRVYRRVNHVTLLGAFAWPLRWLAPVLDDVADFVVTDEPRRVALPASTNGAR
ncbi:alpha/beta hydrolase [Piscinibacter sakaiensis]|uniref:alpha/beta hydrolase n=1 Tax=Piscinibacter sakaiensis TaxID=1547922 RepID=UPI003AADBD2D